MKKYSEPEKEAPLHVRLEAWDNAVPAVRTNYKTRSWLHYTAAVGSALAMATDASAGGGVVYSGSSSVTAGENLTAQFTVGGGNFRLYDLANGFGQAAFLTTGQRYFGGPRVNILTNGSGALQKLASGAKISAGENFWQPGFHSLKNFVKTASGGQQTFGFFSASQPAFAGVRVSVAHTTNASNIVNPTWEYGWVRLEYQATSLSNNAELPAGVSGINIGSQYPTSVSVIDLAYQPTAGECINAGDEGQGGTCDVITSPTPEPGTLALSLLALGAAGVLALRRKKTAVSA